MTNPKLDEKIHALFGADWTGGRLAGTRLGAPEYFSQSSPPFLIWAQPITWL